MEKEKFISLLLKFLQNNKESNLCLIGSGNLMLQGIDVLPNDIDLITDSQTIKNLSIKYGVRCVINKTGYLELEIPLGEAEIHIVSNDNNSVMPPNLEKAFIPISIGDAEVRGLSLESQLYAYLKMDRPKDAKKIELIKEKLAVPKP